MNIKWKEQHYNNSCASACLAMLLSHREIDKQDTDVIKETEMQYLIQLDQNSDSYKAGVLVQGNRYFNLMLNQYGLKLNEYKYSDWDGYITKVNSLLNTSTPFMTGINPKYLRSQPSINSRDGSHAIVVYDKIDSHYMCLDPDLNLSRDIEYKFEDVQNKVRHGLPYEQFLLAVTRRNAGNPLIIGYLEYTDIKSDEKLLIISESIIAIESYLSIAQKKLDNLRLVDNIPSSDEFYDFIMTIIKPIALDLNTAISISDDEVNNTAILAELEIFKKYVLKVQDAIKKRTITNWQDSKDKLVHEISRIQNRILRHLNDRFNELNPSCAAGLCKES